MTISNTYLLVYGNVGELNNPPIHLIAIQRILFVFEYIVRIICVTNYGSYFWQDGKWSEKMSSRYLAQKIDRDDYAGVLLSMNENKYPPGFMNFIELFDGISSNEVSVTEIVKNIIDHNGQRWSCRINTFSSDNDFTGKLWSDTLANLMHDKRPIGDRS